MAAIYKVLGQVLPSTNTLTTAYTVPAASSAVISTIAICNMGPSPATYRIAIRPGGESIALKHYIVYDTSVAPQDTINLTVGITLATTDVVSVFSSNGLVAFNLFGSEIV